MKINDGVLMKVCNDDITDNTFIIPDDVNEIFHYAFYTCTKLKTIVIPNSVTKIDDGAFYNCTSLTSVTIGDNVTSIGDRAFYECTGLTSVTIPDSVTLIGKRAFYGCRSLTNIEVIANNANYQSIDGNLYTKDGKTLIQYATGKTATSFTIPDSVTSISECAFAYCSSLVSVTIGKGVTSIDYAVFAYCSNLKNIIILGNITSINYGAFMYCNNLISKKLNYKAFSLKYDKLYCREKEYIEGKTNSVTGELKMCENGIHYCTNLFEIFDYYCGEIDQDIAIYEIEVGNKVLTREDTSKCCTNSCVLKRRLYHEEIIKILNGEE